MKRIITLSVLLLFSTLGYAQDTEKWVEIDVGKDASWSTNNKLQYNNGVWGETWFNPTYLDYSKGIQPRLESVKKDLHYSLENADRLDSWHFYMELKNMNCIPQQSYCSPNTSNLCLLGSNIIWGFTVELRAGNQIFPITVLLRNSDYLHTFKYAVHDGNEWSEWTETKYDNYPTEPSHGIPTLCVSVSNGNTSIYWGSRTNINYSIKLMDFPQVCDEIVSISLHAGNLAKVCAGKSTLGYWKKEKASKPQSQTNGHNQANKKPLTK